MSGNPSADFISVDFRNSVIASVDGAVAEFQVGVSRASPSRWVTSHAAVVRREALDISAIAT